MHQQEYRGSDEGYLLLIGGPVGSAKTTRAHTEKNKLAYSFLYQREAVTVKFVVDNRFSSGAIVYNKSGVRVSDDGSDVKELTIHQFLNYDFGKYDVILLDEIHIEILRVANQPDSKFTSSELTQQCLTVIVDLVYNQNKNVIACMNDFWGDGEPVEIFHRLMMYASKVKTARGRCDFCGNDCGSCSLNRTIADSNGVFRASAEDQKNWYKCCPKCWLLAQVPKE